MRPTRFDRLMVKLFVATTVANFLSMTVSLYRQWWFMAGICAVGFVFGLKLARNQAELNALFERVEELRGRADPDR